MFSFLSWFTTKPAAAEQPIPSNPEGNNQSADKPADQPLEQHLFVTAVGATVDPDVIVHLGGEDVSKRVGKQVAFGDASGMQIKGGFFGAGSASVATQIAANHKERQMAQDSMALKLEMEKLEMQRRQLELEERRLQFEREKQNVMNGNSNTAPAELLEEQLR